MFFSHVWISHVYYAHFQEDFFFRRFNVEPVGLDQEPYGLIIPEYFLYMQLSEYSVNSESNFIQSK